MNAESALDLPEAPPASLQGPAVDRAAAAILERHGPGNAEAVRRGVAQVAERWWPEDGSEETFVSFCVEGWIASDEERDATFARFEEAMEQVDGHLHEVRRELLRPVHLDLGPVRPVDLLLQN